MLAVDSLGDDLRNRRLPGTTRSTKQIGVSYLVVFQGVFERPGDMFLTGDLIEIGGSIGAVQRFVCHASSLQNPWLGASSIISQIGNVW
jgi:hypothetical protein